MIVGYARVSTSDQNLKNQIELLAENGCEKIYSDITTGIREDRNGLNEMISYLRKRDIVVVYKTDKKYFVL